MKTDFLKLILFLLAFSAPGFGAENLSPPSLKSKKDCEIYFGTASGNDPSVLVELRICKRDRKDRKSIEVAGVLQWSSKTSGWNQRALAGSYSPDTKSMVLHDTGFIEYKPRDGWKFCLIDDYQLRKAGDRLAGFYISTKCRDKAKLDLTLRR